jgi:hypothetical protein
LVPLLPRSVGLRPVFFPAQWRLGHRPIHSLPFPVDANLGVELDQPFLPEPTEHPGLLPGLEAVMDRAARSKTSGQGLPLTSGPKHVEDTVHHLAGRYPWPSPFRVWPLLRQERFHALPQFVWDAPLIVDRCVLCHGPPPIGLADTQHVLFQLSDRL